MATPRVILLSDDKQERRSAELLGNAFYQLKEGQKAAVQLFEANKNIFSEANDADLKQMVFLGHGNKQQYGKYKPKKFAKKFKQQFEKAKGSKNKYKLSVQDLYLVGCGIGLIDDDGKSMAQEIANALHKAGFVNVVVHSIAANKTQRKDELNVHVITREGFAGLQTRLAELNGCAAGKPKMIEGNIYAQLEHADKSLEEVVVANSPKEELNKPCHTFRPNESAEQRFKRVEKDSEELESLTRAEAIALMYRRAVYLKKKLKLILAAKMIEYVKALNLVAVASDDDWQAAVSSILNDAKGLFSQNSNSLKLLRHLSNRRSDRANEVVEEQVSKERQSGASFFPRTSQVVKRVSGAVSRISGTPARVSAEVENAAPIPPEPPVIKLSGELKHRVEEQIENLKGEIKAMQRNCFSRFFRMYEINTKIAKKEVLSQINSEAKTLEQVKELALAAKKKSRVMRQFRSKRTVTLIEEVLSYKP